MTTYLRPALALWLLMLPLAAHADRVVGRINPASHSPSTAAEHAGHDAVTQETRLSNDAITYGLKYMSCWDESHGPGGAEGSAYLGMPLPTGANWYHDGFLRLKINGQDLGAGRAEIWAGESGRRASVKMYFDHPLARVVISNLLHADDDRLFVTIALNPKGDITSLDLALICYPSFFTYWYKRDGDRKVLTATQTYPQAPEQKVALDPETQWYAGFYDTVFDPAKGEGDGGCAVAYTPDQVSAAELMVGSYHCTLDLKVRPKTRLIRLCFWDFNKRGNAEALTRLQAALPQTLELLRSLDPLPLTLAEFDAAAQVEAARRELGDLPGREGLEGRLAEQAAEIERLRRDLAEGRTENPASAEKTLVEKLAAFEQTMWDVKFFALIRG